MKKVVSWFLAALMIAGCLVPLVTFAADDVTLVTEATYPIHTCDSATGFTAKSATLVPKTGLYHGDKNATAMMGTATAGTVQFIANFTPIDLSAYEMNTLYLHFWLYIADAGAKNGGGQIELTSSGTSDSQELHWNTNDYGLSDGWNEFLLPLSVAPSVAPDFRLSNINYFRYYFKVGKEVEVGMDQVEILVQKEIVPAGESAAHVISRCDKATDVATSVVKLTPQSVTLPDGTETTALMGDRPQNDKTETISVNFNAIDLSEYPDEDIFLHFWFYISDASAYKSNTQFELTSGGGCDKEEAHWWTDYYPYKTGWNEYILPLSKADFSSQATGIPFNKSRINYFRFYFTLKKEVQIGIDQIELLTIHPQSYEERFENGIDDFTANGASLSSENGKLKISMQATDAVVGKTVPLNTLNPSTGIVSFNLSSPEKITGGEVRLYDYREKKATYAFSSENFVNGHFHSFLSDTTARDNGFSFYDAYRYEIEIHGQNGESYLLDTVRIMDVSQELSNRIVDVSGELNFETLDECAPIVEGIREDFGRLVEMKNFVVENVATDYVPYYFVLLDMEKEIEAYRNAKNNGLLTTVSSDKLILAAGEPVELTLTLANIGQKALSGLKYSVSYDDMYLQPVDSNLTGTVDVATGTEENVTLRFNALCGGVSGVTIKVTDAANRLLAEHTVRVNVGGEGYYSADCHSHSTISDGKPTLAHNFKSAYDKGMAFIYTADHNATMTNKNDVQNADLIMKNSGYGEFLTIKGCELTVYDANGHLLKYNCDIDFPTLPTGITQADIDLWQQIITTIVEDGGYAYLAHPFHLWYNFPGLTSGEQAKLGKNGYNTWANGGWLQARYKNFYQPDKGIKYYHNYTGIEILNWMDAEAEFHSKAVLEYWDRMNILGEKKYFGIGNSDSHQVDNMALNYNTFLLKELTEHEVNNALGTGSLYVTNGPEMKLTLGGKTFGQTLIVTEPTRKTLKLTAKTFDLPIKEVALYRYTINPDMAQNDAAYAAGEKIVLYTQAKDQKFDLDIQKVITVKPGEFYRVEIRTGSYANLAFSNPIWITDATEEFAFTNEIETFAKGEHRVITWNNENLYDTPHLTSASEYVEVLDNGRVEVAENAPDGYYVITARTDSGKQSAVIIQVGQNLTDPLPEIVYPEAPEEPIDNPPEEPDEPGDDPEQPGDDPEQPGDDPEQPGDDPEQPGDDPDQPGDDDPDQPDDKPTDKKGCKSSVATGIATLFATTVAAVACVFKKKKD